MIRLLRKLDLVGLVIDTNILVTSIGQGTLAMIPMKHS